MSFLLIACDQFVHILCILFETKACVCWEPEKPKLGFISDLLNLLEAQSKSLCDFTSVWTGEVQTQDLLISAPLTYHLRRLKTELKAKEVVF